MLRRFFGTDRLRFSVWSTASGLVENPRSYERFSDAARGMVEVRILQGVHFRTADEVGREQGRRIGNWTFSNHLRPLGNK